MKFLIFRHFDWPLFFAVLLLSLLGIVMIYSTGLQGDELGGLWIRQLLALGLGLLGLFFFSSLDYHYFQRASTWFYLFSIGLLALVLIFGNEIRASRRWFDLGLVNFQPAEFSKFALIVILAKFFQTHKLLLGKFRYVLASMAYALIPAALIIRQPDFGSAAVHLVIWLGLLLISRIPWRSMVLLLLIFAIMGGLAWQMVLHDYQKARVVNFFNPTADPLGQGYNVRQAIVAIGSGGLTGAGLARGFQSQLRFLPERHTDFIFATTIEELGLLGGSVVLVLFLFIFWRLVQILKRARDLFGIYLAAGILFLFLAQSIVNTGMNIGLFPVTGITLPFMSYGGSSLVITLFLIGVVQNISQSSIPVKFR